MPIYLFYFFYICETEKKIVFAWLLYALQEAEGMRSFFQNREYDSNFLNEA